MGIFILFALLLGILQSRVGRGVDAEMQESGDFVIYGRVLCAQLVKDPSTSTNDQANGESVGWFRSRKRRFSNIDDLYSAHGYDPVPSAGKPNASNGSPTFRQDSADNSAWHPVVQSHYGQYVPQTIYTRRGSNGYGRREQAQQQRAANNPYDQRPAPPPKPQPHKHHDHHPNHQDRPNHVPSPPKPPVHMNPTHTFNHQFEAPEMHNHPFHPHHNPSMHNDPTHLSRTVMAEHLEQQKRLAAMANTPIDPFIASGAGFQRSDNGDVDDSDEFEEEEGNGQRIRRSLSYSGANYTINLLPIEHARIKVYHTDLEDNEGDPQSMSQTQTDSEGYFRLNASSSGIAKLLRLISVTHNCAPIGDPSPNSNRPNYRGREFVDVFPVSQPKNGEKVVWRVFALGVDNGYGSD